MMYEKVRALKPVHALPKLLYVNIQNGYMDYEVSIELKSLHFCGIFKQSCILYLTINWRKNKWIGDGYKKIA
jgi:hypothetical protein